jgi:hypothetical protein
MEIRKGEINQDLAEQIGGPSVPLSVPQVVNAVLSISPFDRAILYNRNGTITTTGTSAIVMPTDDDYYLSYLTLSVVKDVTCDVSSGAINFGIYSRGALTYVISVPVLTLTASSMTITICLKNPIKLDPDTDCTINGNFAAGSMVRTWNGGFLRVSRS